MKNNFLYSQEHTPIFACPRQLATTRKTLGQRRDALYSAVGPNFRFPVRRSPEQDFTLRVYDALYRPPLHLLAFHPSDIDSHLFCSIFYCIYYIGL